MERKEAHKEPQVESQGLLTRESLAELTLDVVTLSPSERRQFLPVAFVGCKEVILLALCEYEFTPLLDRLKELYGPDTRLCAPPAFRFDGTSNPKITRAIVDQFDPYLWATMFHDLAYATELFAYNGEGDYGQREADYWYRKLLKHWGLPAWKANVRHAAVRSFGWVKHPHPVESVALERAKHCYPGNPWHVPVADDISQDVILAHLVSQVEAERGSHG